MPGHEGGPVRPDAASEGNGRRVDGERWTVDDLRGWTWDRLTATYRALDAQHAELVRTLERAARERHAADFEH